MICVMGKMLETYGGTEWFNGVPVPGGGLLPLAAPGAGLGVLPTPSSCPEDGERKRDPHFNPSEGVQDPWPGAGCTGAELKGIEVK